MTTTGSASDELRKAVGSLDGVAAAHVVPSEASDGGFCLCVYLVARPGASHEARAAALDEARARGPAVACVFLPRLPVRPDGNIDEDALPPLSSNRPPLAGDCVAPRDAVEAGVVRAWEAVLSLAPVGVHDDFFDLGGSSLQAFALVTVLNQAYGTRFKPSDLFDATSPAAMAAVAASVARDT